MSCRRALVEGEAVPPSCGLHDLPNALKMLLQTTHGVNNTEDGDEAKLDEVLNRALSSPWLIQNLEPHFAKKQQHAMINARSRGRVAVIIPGAVRTMLRPEHMAEFGEFFHELRQRAAYLRTFAYLAVPNEIGCLAESCGSADSRAAATVEATVRKAFAGWGVGLDLQMHSSSAALRPPAVMSVCAGQHAVVKRLVARHERIHKMGFGRKVRADELQGAPQLHQFRKVYVAFAMMAAHETAEGEPFGIVVRVRPDLCMRAAGTFLRYALPRAASMPIAFLSSDGVAVLPRWTAEAYSEYWRHWGAECAPPTAWHRTTSGETRACSVLSSRRGQPENGAPSHFLYMTAGILGVDLHHFWRSPPASGMRRPTITLLRRGGECMMWS